MQALTIRVIFDFLGSFQLSNVTIPFFAPLVLPSETAEVRKVLFASHRLALERCCFQQAWKFSFERTHFRTSSFLVTVILCVRRQRLTHDVTELRYNVGYLSGVL